jgi:hypothetical protein
MKRMLAVAALALTLGGFADVSHAAQASNAGVRGGVGTDIGGGIAYGLGLNYIPATDASGSWELGIVAYGGSFKETTTEFFTYEEKTTIAAYGVLANRLFHYRPMMKGGYAIAGAGVGAVSVTWEERSSGDITLGTRLAGGGSMQSLSSTGAGAIVNVGAGYGFGGPWDVRVEAPILFISGPPGGASSVAPTLTVTAGVRF